MTSASPTGMERLGQAVRNRRAQLGLAQGDLKAHGGPSVVVVGQIERAEQDTLQPMTLARLDTALKWPPGTSAAILNGNLDEPPQELIALRRSPVSFVGPGEQDDDLRYQRPAGMPDLQWQRIRDRARAFIEFELDQAAKER